MYILNNLKDFSDFSSVWFFTIKMGSGGSKSATECKVTANVDVHGSPLKDLDKNLGFASNSNPKYSVKENCSKSHYHIELNL